MSTWFLLFPPLLLAVGILAIIGLPLSLALRLRGYFAIAAAIPAAFAAIALSSIIGPMLGFEWNILSPFVVTILASIVLLVISKWVGPRQTVPLSPRQVLVPLAAAALGGITVATTLMMSMKNPDAVSQTYDANFHLNAVQLILDTSSASPFAMDLAAPGTNAFYPTVWHAFVVLIVQLSGASIPLATNAAVFTVCAVVWPLGAVALGRAFAGPSARVSVITGVLSAAFPSFPLVLAGYGVLYPNLLSVALIPYAAVGIMQLLSLAQARRSEFTSAGAAWLLFLAATGSAILAHPNAIHIMLLWLAGPVIWVIIRAFRREGISDWNGLQRLSRLRPVLRRLTSLAALIVYIALLVAAWYVGHTGDNPWGGSHGPFGALRDALGMTPHLEGHAWPVTVLFLIGAILILRIRSLRWALLSGAVLLGAYVIADGFAPAEWRTALLLPWYSDPWRLAALIWLAALPIAVIGASAAWSIARIGVLSTAHRVSKASWFRNAAAIVAIAFLLASTQGAGAFAGTRYVSSQYEATSSARLLSPDERDLIERLPSHLPEDAVIINNPWNGGALAYALAGVPVLTPHTGSTYDQRIEELIAYLGEDDPRACGLANEVHAFYVLDFGTGYIFEDTPRAEPFEGITDVKGSSLLTEIDRQGDAVLYELTGCQ